MKQLDHQRALRLHMGLRKLDGQFHQMHDTCRIRRINPGQVGGHVRHNKVDLPPRSLAAQCSIQGSKRFLFTEVAQDERDAFNRLGSQQKIVFMVAIAALIAAAGVAIGMAWSGLLANFAAGAFLVVLRPLKVGDFVTVAGVTGTVTELGLFTTTLNTPDNVQTIVGNNKVFGDTIQNFSVNPFRRVDLKCQLSGAADHTAAMALLREKIAAIPNVLAEPKVDVEILDFTLVGPVLAVRPYCHTDNYWQVYFDTNKTIRESLAEAGFPAPMPAQNVIVTQSN